MEPEKLLEALHTAEKLKDTTRHCYTSKGRHESVAVVLGFLGGFHRRPQGLAVFPCCRGLGRQ